MKLWLALSFGVWLGFGLWAALLWCALGFAGLCLIEDLALVQKPGLKLARYLPRGQDAAGR